MAIQSNESKKKSYGDSRKRHVSTWATKSNSNKSKNRKVDDVQSQDKSRRPSTDSSKSNDSNKSKVTSGSEENKENKDKKIENNSEDHDHDQELSSTDKKKK